MTAKETDKMWYHADDATGLIAMSEEPPKETTGRRISITPYATVEEKADVQSGYMVSVDGNTAPKRVHATIEDAKQEAERLSKTQNGKTIRVMLLVGVYEPTHAWRELV